MPIVLTSINMTLRLPVAVHRAVRNAAKESGRSLNTEIVERLNQSLGMPYLSEKAVDENVMTRLIDLEARVAKLETKKGGPGGSR
jgi:hypothetical protein